MLLHYVFWVEGLEHLQLPDYYTISRVSKGLIKDFEYDLVTFLTALLEFYVRCVFYE